MKKILLLPLLLSFSFADTVEEKVFHAEDSNHEQYYNSANLKDTEDQVISSSIRVSAEITVAVTVQASTEITSGAERGRATISFLDNNRIQITEDIAKGEGEHLDTLLGMLAVKKDKKTLKILQENFDALIYLSHNDFLNKIESLV